VHEGGEAFEHLGLLSNVDCQHGMQVAAAQQTCLDERVGRQGIASRARHSLSRVK
jgi:hypothetical protein